MIRLAQRKLFLAFDSMGYRVILMGSKDFLPPKFPVTSTVLSYSSSSQSRLFRSPSRGNVGFCASTRHFSPVSQNAYCCRNISIPVPRPIPGVDYDARHSQSQLAAQRQLTALQEKLKIIGIDASGCLPGGTYPMICPFCKGGDSQEKCLTLYIANNGGAAEYTCFAIGCGKTGVTRVSAGEKSTYGSMSKLSIPKKVTKVITEEGLELEPLSQEAMDWFDTRNISKETVQRNGIMEKRMGDTVTIAFVYRRNGEAVSCKYRDLTKKFWTEANTEKIFYGLDDIKEASDIIIVEGEMDKLAMEEAGFRNCVSVPDGAPPKVSNKALPPEEEDTKYRYLWNCKDYIAKASRIILATDGDPPGIALAEELARRLGRERCWRVKWPIMGDKSCKDANEVLSYKGPAALRQVIENAELYPIRGLFNFKDFFDEIDAYYYQSLGFELGVSTGWTALNQLYNIVPGELTIVTGVPNSGKSEWIDALLCNLNRTVGWKFALCSMENKVREHARKLLEKHMKKPFFDRYEGYERISIEELETGKKWLNDTFYLIRCENDCLPSVNWVLDLARIAVMRHGVHGLVIDPYNEIDHQRPPSQTETEYVSQMLTKIKRFAQHHACHVWFVAHPRQLHNWDGGPPNMYDISGSAHFINKCDNGIVIHRNRDPEAGPIDLVQVCVRKVRNKVIGTIGDAFLSYNKVTGVYSDVDMSTIKPINKNNGINNSQGKCPSNAGYSSGR